MKHFLDFETTGVDPWRNSAVSLGWIITDDDNNPIAKFYEECCPNVMNWTTWTKQAQEVHGFTPQYIVKQQSETVLVEKLFSFLGKHCNGERGNLHYHADSHIDYKFLMGILAKNMESRVYEIYKYVHPHGRVNTMVDFRKHLGNGNHGLSKIARHYKIQLRHHNALSDTEVLVEAYKRMNDEIKERNTVC